jgi:hypothetical protein
MCDVTEPQMGSNVYGPLSAADDFGQQRVSRKWFGDQGICLYHRISQPVGCPLNTITGTCAVAGAALSSASTDRPDRSCLVANSDVGSKSRERARRHKRSPMGLYSRVCRLP